MSLVFSISIALSDAILVQNVAMLGAQDLAGYSCLGQGVSKPTERAEQMRGQLSVTALDRSIPSP